MPKITLISDEKIHSWVQLKYLNIRRKYLQSIGIFVLLNIIAFSVTAVITILNIYVLKNNPIPSTKTYFIASSILAGCITFLTALLSFFKFKTLSNSSNEKLLLIKVEEQMFKSRTGIYQVGNADLIFTERIIAIENGELQE